MNVRISQDVRRQLRREVGDLLPGYSALSIEVGIRASSLGDETRNAMLWADDADLAELVPLYHVKNVLSEDGTVWFDLYVYTGQGATRELITNLYATITPESDIVVDENRALGWEGGPR